MEKIIFRVIIITGACCLSTKHIFHDWYEMSWENARAHCREYHNDLSRLSNELEEELFKDSVDVDNEGWIGIYWNQDLLKFVWSGGEDVIYHNNLDLPTTLNPNSSHQEDNVYWTKDHWQWKKGDENHHFFCFSLKLVQEEKTWEEALELCRMNHNNLSSLLSDTDTLLATNEMNRTDSTEPVWIGLRYLGDDWMWLNGESLVLKAWSEGGDQDHRCPEKRRCGALTRQGVWENRDCQEKLWFMCG